MRSKLDYVYLYTVRLRTKDGWVEKDIEATSMVEISRELALKLDDIQYITKVRIR